jgi:hypothetical protein
MIEITLGELLGVVFVAVALAATDAAALSRLAVAFLAKKLGVEPDEIRATDRATDGE